MILKPTYISGTTIKITYFNNEYPDTTNNYSLVLNGPICKTYNFTGQELIIPASEEIPEGKYQFSIFADSLTESYVLEQGFTTFSINPKNIDSGIDNSTHYERVLEAIEAVIEKRATLDQQKYEINGRALERMPIDDLLKLRDYYITKLQSQNNKVQKRILARFV